MAAGMVNVCICSNDASTLSLLQRLIAQQLFWDDAEVLTFSDKATCLAEINRAVPDIAIIDTVLADGSGIDLAEKLTEYSLRCQILFVSSDISQSLDVYRVEHTAFVLKDQLAERMPYFLQRSYERIQKEKVALCLVKNRNEQRIFQQKDIIYIQRNLRQLEINTFSRKELVYGNLDEILKQLNPYYFAQCHKSYIVNLEHLIGISGEEAQICTGVVVPVSRLYRKTFFAQYKKFIGNQSMLDATAVKLN